MNKFKGTVMGVAGLAIFVLVFPDAKDAYDLFASDMLAITGITGGLSYLIITSMPYIFIIIAVATTLWSLFHKERR